MKKNTVLIFLKGKTVNEEIFEAKKKHRILETKFKQQCLCPRIAAYTFQTNLDVVL